MINPVVVGLGRRRHLCPRGVVSFSPSLKLRAGVALWFQRRFPVERSQFPMSNVQCAPHDCFILFLQQPTEFFSLCPFFTTANYSSDRCMISQIGRGSDLLGGDYCVSFRNT